MTFLSKREKRLAKKAERAAAAGRAAPGIAQGPIDQRIVGSAQQPVGDNTGVGESTKQPPVDNDHVAEGATPFTEAEIAANAHAPTTVTVTPALPASFIDTPDSSQIDAYGYNAEARALFIRFKSKDKPLWCYDNVDEKLYGHFLAAASKGSFFIKQIKPNHPAVFIQKAA